MKRTLATLILLPLCGCTSIVKELKKPPYPMIVAHHARVVGIKASYSGYGLQLGFCSETFTFIPCSTNGLTSPTFSDKFKLGQSGLDTSIVEQIDAGFKDQPPPLMRQLFSPKETPPAPAHAIAFGSNQTEAQSYISGNVVTISLQEYLSLKSAADSTTTAPPLPK